MQNDLPVSLLLLFPKTPFDIDIPTRRAACLELIEATLGVDLARRVCLITSAEHFTNTFAACGDWESWIWNTVHGKNYITRKSTFGGFIVMTTATNRCGKATAAIAGLALRSNGVVLHDDGQQLKAVKHIDAPEANPSWVDGWVVHSVPL